MHAFDRHAAFADRGGATFNRAGTYVARCENARPTRFPAPRRTLHAQATAETNIEQIALRPQGRLSHFPPTITPAACN
jgi:hypothetical protein